MPERSEQSSPQYGSEQERAIFLARASGLKIAKEHPEIAEKYRDGKTYEDLASEYLPDITSKDVAASAIGYAIRELMTKEERESIDKARRERVGRKQGIRTKEKGE